MTEERLDRKTFQTAGPTFILQFLSQLLQISVGICLVRILSPEDYGIWGIFMIFSAFCNLFINSGFSSAILQKRKITQEDLDSVFFYNILLSLFFVVLISLTSPYIASFFHQPILTDILRVVVWVFPISAFGTIPNLILARRMLQHQSSICSFIGALIALVPTLFLAFHHYGVWALAWQIIITQFFSTILVFIFCHWTPGLNFSLKALGNLFSFGSNIMVAGILDNIFAYIYNFVIGKFYPIADLGYFERARQYVNVWPNTGQCVLISILFPAFSQIQDDIPRLKQAIQMSLQMALCFIVFPSILIGVLAEPIIILIFGGKWLPMLPYFYLLTIYVASSPITIINHQAVTARGKGKEYLVLVSLNKILTIVNLACTAWISITAMVWGMVMISFIGLYTNTRLTKWHLNYGLRAQIKDSLPYLLYSLIASGATYGLYLLLWPINHWLGLFVPMAAGCVIYLLLNVFCYSPAFDTAWRLGKEQLKGWFGK